MNIGSVSRVVPLSHVSGAAGYALEQPDSQPRVAEVAHVGSMASSPPARPLIAFHGHGAPG